MIRNSFFAAALVLAAAQPAVAQQGWRWADDGPGYGSQRGRDDGFGYGSQRGRTYYYPAPPTYYRDSPPPRYVSPYRQGATSFLDEDEPRRRRSNDTAPDNPKLLDGGARPEIAPIGPERMRFESRYGPGTIIVDTAGRQLLLTQANGTALRYPISVGRDGFSWTGEEKVSRIAEWPDWHPPAEMRERDPKLPEKMTGGLKNPLGAKALYLGNSLYRIHGTNDAKTIGRASSSGCFRMLNGHVIDLAERVGVGTKVVVVSSLRGA